MIFLWALSGAACSSEPPEGENDDGTSWDVVADTDGASDAPVLEDVSTDSPGDSDSGPASDSTASDAPAADKIAPHPDAHPWCVEGSPVFSIPAEETAWTSQGFDRMAQVVVPGGGTIDIIAQDQVTDEMIVRARNIILFFLTDVPGSEYGADKTAVANKMAEQEALLMLPNGFHQEGNEPNLPGQPLYHDEMTVEGSDWYMNNNFEHRDASFEEIFHLVHDAGIGTFMPGALPDYQAELLAEAKAAIADGRWGIPVDPGVQDWLDELEAEDSLAQEYIASVIDSYYGYWGAWTEAPGGMWGIYIAKTREEVAQKDPAGKALLEKFLSPWLTYDAWISTSLQGQFSMTFDAQTPYTHKSQYLVNARLTGSNGSSLKGNGQDNVLRGNVGNNTIDGVGGHDTVVYCQLRSAYTVDKDGGGFIVNGPDGIDTLKNIESVHFLDGPVPAADLK